MLKKLTYQPAQAWRRITRNPVEPMSETVLASTHSLATREGLTPLLETTGRAVEIGPGVKPMITGENVEYFDVEDRAADQRDGPTSIPEITHISKTADLSIVPSGAELVCTSHVIEHTPDLIAHLLDVERILSPGGRYVIISPDKRFCFDAALPPSHLGKVISAHLEKRKTHSFQSIYESYVLRTHNRSGRHWRGNSFDDDYLKDHLALTKAALAQVCEADGAYVNSHAWQFTPSSFDMILRDLKALDFISLDVEFVGETPPGRNEFTACLVKPAQ